MNFADLIPNIVEHLTEDPRQAERERHVEAREVLGRIPELVRFGTPAELEARICAPDLLAAAKTCKFLPILI